MRRKVVLLTHFHEINISRQFTEIMFVKSLKRLHRLCPTGSIHEALCTLINFLVTFVFIRWSLKNFWFSICAEVSRSTCREGFRERDQCQSWNFESRQRKIEWAIADDFPEGYRSVSIHFWKHRRQNWFTTKRLNRSSIQLHFDIDKSMMNFNIAAINLHDNFLLNHLDCGFTNFTVGDKTIS